VVPAGGEHLGAGVEQLAHRSLAPRSQLATLGGAAGARSGLVVGERASLRARRR
jgi:hypothetical protein